MAIAQTITQATGVDATYHRIARVRVYIEQYKDEQARRNGAEPLAVDVVYLANDGANDSVIAYAYEQIAALPQYQGGEAV